MPANENEEEYCSILQQSFLSSSLSTALAAQPSSIVSHFSDCSKADEASATHSV